MAVKANRVIRVFVIIILAVATTLFLYLLINNFQFTRGRVVKIHFSSVGDLNNGAWVRKAGIKVGSVTRLEPAADEKTINVTVQFRPEAIVRAGDKFALVAKGILGDMYIEQTAGPKDEPLVKDGQFFEGQPSFNITDLLGGDTMGMITDLLASIKKFTDGLGTSQGSIDTTMKDIAKTMENVRIITDRTVVATDSLPQITKQIQDSIDELQATVQAFSDKSQKIFASVEGVVGDGSNDVSASLKSIHQISSDLQRAVTDLTSQSSVISKLGTPETAQSVTLTLKNLQDISQELLTASKETETLVKGLSGIFDSGTPPASAKK